MQDVALSSNRFEFYKGKYINPSFYSWKLKISHQICRALIIKFYKKWRASGGIEPLRFLVANGFEVRPPHQKRSAAQNRWANCKLAELIL